jgi:transposase
MSCANAAPWCRAIRYDGFPNAKRLHSKKTLFAAEQDRPDVARRRLRWKKYQGRIDPNRLVFIDETWAKTNMTRTRGWNACGKPLVAKVPHGHWKTMTFLAALRHDRITAPFVLDGPINGDAFLAYVEQVLVPTLAPGDVVVMDNLGSHKSDKVRTAIRKADARLLFLPPYSPDLNPIEQVFAKLKPYCAKPKSAPSRPYGNASARCSIASNPASAPHISATAVMLQPKSERL